MITPVRLQLRRTKGFHLESPNGLPIANVTRRGKWGNPFRIGSDLLDLPFIVIAHMRDELGGHLTREQAVKAFETWLGVHYEGRALLESARLELRGKNLACVCGLDQACHADVWLRAVNE